MMALLLVGGAKAWMRVARLRSCMLQPSAIVTDFISLLMLIYRIAFICKWNAVLWQSCGASIFASKLRTSVGHSALVHRHYCLRGTQEHMWDDLLYAHAGAAIDGHHIIMVMAVGRLGGTFDEMESFCCRIAINNQKSEAISATTMMLLHYIFWYLAF